MVKRERKQLFSGMIKRKLNKLWLSQASINIGNSPEILKLAFKSGCRSLFIGFESPSAANLRQVKKSPNVAMGTGDGIRHAARAIRHAGIGIIGSFIIGFDNDDITIFDKTLSLAQEADSVQFQILTPFPGTDLYKHLLSEKRIIYDNYPDDWSRCDMDHLVIKPRNMDLMDLVRGVDYLIDRTFSQRAIIVRAFRTLVHTRSITSTILAFSLNKDSAKIFSIQKKY